MQKTPRGPGVETSNIHAEGFSGCQSIRSNHAERTLQPRRKNKTAMTIKLKRVYAEWAKADGTRILVDRLWPRGLTKEKAHVDLWLKDVAPSAELRRWFAHDPVKWTEFKTRYRTELKHHHEPIELLKQAITKSPVTLLYGARDQEHNHAIVLRELLNHSTKNTRQRKSKPFSRIPT
jgi:uncharacterized protein YeaO (DUF488 family)